MKKDTKYDHSAQTAAPPSPGTPAADNAPNFDFLTAYRRRMTRTAVVTSLCFGLIAGAGVAFLAALLCFILGINGVWIAVGAGIGAAALTGVLLYALKFRPTEHDVVRQIDRMGLEERTVTMMELRGNASAIAGLQRSDADRAIRSVKKAQIERAFPVFALKKGAAAALGISLFAAVGMTTVAGLAQAGVLPSPGILTPEREQFVAVSYWVEEGGEIQGEADQILLPGQDATPVVAVAEDGWIFVRWSDGSKSTQRTDRAVTADLTITAIFEEIGEEGDGEGAGDAIDKEQEGDYDKDAPDPDENEGAGAEGDAGDGGEGDGDGATGEGSGQGSGGQEGEGQGDGQGDGAGGGWSNSNMIIDGETDYRDVFDNYYNMAMELIESGSELPPELIEFIERYFGSL